MSKVQSWFSSEDGERYTLTPQPDLPLSEPDASQSFRVVTQEQQFLATVPDKTVATYRWTSRETADAGARESMV